MNRMLSAAVLALSLLGTAHAAPGSPLEGLFPRRSDCSREARLADEAYQAYREAEAAFEICAADVTADCGDELVRYVTALNEWADAEDAWLRCVNGG